MTTWLTLREAAQYAKAGKRCLYSAVRDGRLRAARINQRGDLRFNAEWLDAWLSNSTEPQTPAGAAQQAAGQQRSRERASVATN